MKRQRAALLALGVLLGMALVWGEALAVARISPHHHQRAQSCLPYFLIPKELVCASHVYWTNPDGSRVVMGKTSQLAPMPRPRPVLER